MQWKSRDTLVKVTFICKGLIRAVNVDVHIRYLTCRFLNIYKLLRPTFWWWSLQKKSERGAAAKTVFQFFTLVDFQDWLLCCGFYENLILILHWWYLLWFSHSSGGSRAKPALSLNLLPNTFFTVSQIVPYKNYKGSLLSSNFIGKLFISLHSRGPTCIVQAEDLEGSVSFFWSF